jgi:hypothetical protein
MEMDSVIASAPKTKRSSTLPAKLVDLGQSGGFAPPAEVGG